MAKARTASTALARLLQEASAPLYVLDETRHLVFANAALLNLLEIEEEALLGERCDYHSTETGESGASLGASLCPPPEVFSGERVAFLITLSRDGMSVRHRAECIPLAEGAVGTVPVLVTMAVAEHAKERETGAHDEPEQESRELHERLAAWRKRVAPRYRFDRLAGESAALRRVRAQAELAARGGSNVLIVGPRGSGREHLARAIHLAAGVETAGPLVPLPCALLDSETVQITLRRLKRRPAGHERESAGLLLLLDVDQMPADAQDEMAGFLNLPEFRIATLATARRPLLDLAAEAGFRHDLACLLGTLVIELPPLAERREDIPLLAQMLLEEENREGDAQLSGFTPEALDELAAYPWPGNMDELAEFVRESCAKAVGPWVGTQDLPARVRQGVAAAALVPPVEEPIVLDEFLAEIERELIERALARSKGNRTKAASLLGMQRGRLLRRLVQLGLAEPGTGDGAAAPVEQTVADASYSVADASGSDGAGEPPIPFEEVEPEVEFEEQENNSPS